MEVVGAETIRRPKFANFFPSFLSFFSRGGSGFDMVCVARRAVVRMCEGKGRESMRGLR